jgi:hypothetical protein
MDLFFLDGLVEIMRICVDDREGSLPSGNPLICLYTRFSVALGGECMAPFSEGFVHDNLLLHFCIFAVESGYSKFISVHLLPLLLMLFLFTHDRVD